MKLWTTLSEQDLRRIGADVGVGFTSAFGGSPFNRDGRAYNFRLALDRERGKRDGDCLYQRYSTSGFNPDRRVAAVCWHGHRDFMRAVFAEDPDARFKTAFADYRGAADFEASYRATGSRNIGSMMYPCRADEACRCGSNGWPVTRDLPGANGEVTMMRQSDVLTCPHVILIPDHYRADGTCRCDDARERERMIAEWDYQPEDFAGIPLRSA